jgi:hypothetical protein
MALLNSARCRPSKKGHYRRCFSRSVIPSTFDYVCMKEDQLVAHKAVGWVTMGTFSLQGGRPAVNVVLQQVVDGSTTSRSTAAATTIVLYCRIPNIGGVAPGTASASQDGHPATHSMPIIARKAVLKGPSCSQFGSCPHIQYGREMGWQRGRRGAMPPTTSEIEMQLTL